MLTGGFFTVGLPDLAVASGSVYYEITLLQLGPCPQIGWVPSGWKQSIDNGVGDDKFSLGYDGVRHKVWWKGVSEKEGPYVDWEKGMTVGFAIKFQDAEEEGKSGRVVAWVGRNGVWEKASWGSMERTLGEYWGTHGVFRAMTGMDLMFRLEPAPRHDGPDPSFRYVVGASRPRVLDGLCGEECTLKDAVGIEVSSALIASTHPHPSFYMLSGL